MDIEDTRGIERHHIRECRRALVNRANKRIVDFESTRYLCYHVLVYEINQEDTSSKGSRYADVHFVHMCRHRIVDFEGTRGFMLLHTLWTSKALVTSCHHIVSQHTNSATTQDESITTEDPQQQTRLLTAIIP